MRNLEGTILEHRETRGGKYALVMREYAHGLYDLMAYDNGRLHWCGKNYPDAHSVYLDFYRRMEGRLRWDKINYNKVIVSNRKAK